MTTIPDAAIEAAAEAACLVHLRGERPVRVPSDPDPRNHIAACYGCQSRARAAIEAALPAIREALAQEIEDAFDAGCEVGHDCDKQSGDWNDGHLFALERAARIVRGGAT
jgi:hypothetical protein